MIFPRLQPQPFQMWIQLAKLDSYFAQLFKRVIQNVGFVGALWNVDWKIIKYWVRQSNKTFFGSCAKTFYKVNFNVGAPRRSSGLERLSLVREVFGSKPALSYFFCILKKEILNLELRTKSRIEPGPAE